MSAFIVDREHIVYLVDAAMSRRLNPHGGAFRWHMNGELYASDYERAAELANRIWQENFKSFSHRYPNELVDDRAYKITARDLHAFAPSPDPVQVLKACDCLEYQSCEHPEWGESEAKDFIDSLRKRAWQSLPGYDDADWGAPRKKSAISNLPMNPAFLKSLPPVRRRTSNLKS